jgi:hypothetical protein
MAPITQALLSALLLVATVQPTFSAPVKGLAVRQLAGEGQAADALFTDVDNGVGYGTENAEDNAASLVSSVTGKSGGSTAGGSSGSPPPPPHKRQLAGEGQALDSLFTDVDNGVGYGTENAEDNLASDISSVTGKSGGSTAGGSSGGSPPPPPPPKKRQANKICNGAGELTGSLGIDSGAAVTACDNADGELTDGAANAGSTVGSTIETTLESAGNVVPSKIPKRDTDMVHFSVRMTRRQANKICAGESEVAGSLGLDTDSIVTACDNVDGDLTDGAANIGSAVGTTVEGTLIDTGNAVPSSNPLGTAATDA